jgi:ABC-2 type transport system permease protein
VHLYLAVAARSFRRHLTYRAATVAGLFTNTIWGVMLSAVFLAFYRDRENAVVAHYAVADMLTFVWVGQSLITVIAIWGTWEISQSIRSGDVVSDLMKPMSYFGYWLSQDLGRAACQVVTRFGPTLLIGAVAYDLVLPRSTVHWLEFGVSLALAVIVSFGWRFLLNLSAFWLLDVRGVHLVALGFVQFFSGMLLPLTFFPPWLRQIAEVLPFRAFVMTPIEVFLGQRPLVEALAGQLGWGIALMLIGQGGLILAVRKVVVQGG